MPRIGFGAPDTSAFRRNSVSPVGATKPAVSSVVEVPGGGELDRTDDLLLAKQALSQLSYTPFSGIRDQ